MVLQNPEVGVEQTGHTESLDYYHREIGRIPLLSAEEEVTLSMDIEAGLYAGYKLRQHTAGGSPPLPVELQEDLKTLVEQGDKARHQMISANLRLVVSVAKYSPSRGLPFADVVAEGNAGLIRAVEKFDYQKGYKFSTYATWWIRQAIEAATKDTGRTIRIPKYEIENIEKASKASERLMTQLGREPTSSELAEELGISLERLRQLQIEMRSTLSLDAPPGESNEQVLGENLSGPVSIEGELLQKKLYQTVEDAIGRLEETERQVLLLSFSGKSFTFDEIAQVLRLNDRRKVSALLGSSLAKLRHPAMALSNDNEPWREEGICVQIGPEAFFIDRGANEAKQAARVCNDCPVLSECLEFVLKNNITAGIWGGMTAQQRIRLNKTTDNELIDEDYE